MMGTVVMNMREMCMDSMCMLFHAHFPMRFQQVAQ